jgi:Fe2+ transport system protein FeoA
MSDAHHEHLCEDECPASDLCPLNSVPAGSMVRIKQLSGSDDMNDRLREMGFCEDREIRLISQSANLLCQVCNARLGLNPQIAESIIVEPLGPKAPRKVA